MALKEEFTLTFNAEETGALMGVLMLAASDPTTDLMALPVVVSARNKVVEAVCDDYDANDMPEVRKALYTVMHSL